MARDIDLTSKLNEADREYLLARGREQQVFANDAEFSDDPEALSRALYVPGTEIDKAEGVPETPDPDAEEIEGEEDDENADPAEGDDYETWTHDALQEEIRRRNAEYAEEFQIPVSGKKKELVARLRDDDQDEESEEDPDA